MFFINEYNKSLGQKIIIMITFIIALVSSAWLMFYPGGSRYQIDGDLIRRIVLLSCSVIYIIRIAIMAFVFLKRKLVWLEAITIAILMPIIIFVLSYAGGNQSLPINLFDITGILLYLFGSYVNTRSEYLRHLWKQNPANKGQVYTQGLFKYSMHINYFGDVVLFAGWAMITQHSTLLLIPLFMALNFAIFIIPSLDNYLEQKYGKEFQKYAAHTKKLIPLIY